MEERLILNCVLCEENSLHAMGGEIKTQQCINCGYVSSDNFKIDEGVELKDFDGYKSLSDDMKSWSKEVNGRLWIPSIMTLPFGTLYPENIDGEMKWSFAKMVDIPVEEQKNYPDKNGGYYTRKYDIDNSQKFNVFIEAISSVNEIFKKNEVVNTGG